MSCVQAVVAGSKGFVDALGASLRLRLGAAPVVARDPGEALLACADAGGLLVLEYAGADWLGAVRDLRTRRDRASLAIVAAVPGARLAEVEALRQAGVDEAVRWDSRVDPVVWAVDRLLGARSAAAAALAGAAPVLAEAPPPLPGIAPAATVAAAPPAAPAAAAAPPPAPGALPPLAEVEALLEAALRGEIPAPALRGTTERTLPALTDAERSALEGAPLGVDPAPLRRAAALRWRALAMLEHLRSGGGIDAAVTAAPAEIDAALAALKELSAGAPRRLLAPLAATRNALVKDAIELTEAAARAQSPEPPPVPAPAAAPRAPAARVLSNESTAPGARPAHPGLWIAVTVAALLAAGYHVDRYRARPRGEAIVTPTLPGAPAGTILVTSGPTRSIVANAGATVDPRQLESFRQQEAARGNVVRQLSPGTWIIEPAPPAGGPP